MKKGIAIGLVLILSACNAHALRQMLVPEPTPMASFSRMQFNCTANGLFIFEDFPDLATDQSDKRNPPVTSVGASTQTKTYNADITRKCLYYLN